MSTTLAVVGGGVIGLSIAWRAASAGFSVQLFDPAIASGASDVAGGMLAPLSEGWPGEDVALDLGAQSLLRWPAFAEELSGESLLTSHGALTVAFDSADADDLRTIADWVSARGHDVRIVDRRAVRELEPAVAQTVRLGLFAPDELSVDNRRLLVALTEAFVAAGGSVVAEAVHDVAALDTDQVVIAAGWHSAGLTDVPVRPVKGEILRVRRRPGSTPPPERTVRACVNGRAVYLVPRHDGIVIGATQYENGDDTTVTVGGVRDLIADAERVFPGIGDYELAESAAGLRPVSRDNVPVVGRVDDRTVVATAHGRNGMLLAPLTADAVLAELNGSPLSEARSFTRPASGLPVTRPASGLPVTRPASGLPVTRPASGLPERSRPEKELS